VVVLNDATNYWEGTASTEWQTFELNVVAVNEIINLGSTGNMIGAYIEFDDVLITEF
jgi:hypothetical protein